MLKLLTIIISRDLAGEVEALLPEVTVDCYVKVEEAYGISQRHEKDFDHQLPWEAAMILVTGEEQRLREIAGLIRERLGSKNYKPCLRMMLQSVDQVWV